MRAQLKWPRSGPMLEYPIPPAPRTAVLIPGFRSAGEVKVFAEGWCEAAAKFAPQAIAGTLAQFEAIAATKVVLSHAVIVIGRWRREGPCDARLREADREMLWKRFRVPVFEQIVAEDGTLLAAECEAHYGLHITSERVLPGVREGDRMDESACGCGRTTARLISREEIEREEQLRQVATYAR